MTLRSLVGGSFLITVANLVPRAGAFLLLPIYARVLSRADFGTLSLAGSAALLLAIAYRLGLDAALLRMHPDLDGTNRRHLYATLVAICLATAAGVTLAAAVIAPLVVAPELIAIVVLALAIGALNTFQFVPSVWFRATGQVGRYLALAIGAFAVIATSTVALVVILRLGVVGSLFGQLLGALVMAAVALGILLRQRPWRFRSDLARQGLSFGLPLLPHTLAGWVLNVSDRAMLGLLLGLAATEALAAIGVYSLGYQLGYVVALVAISFNAAWLPLLYRVGNRPDGPAIVREAATVAIAAFTGLAAAVAILAPDIVAIIAPPEWAAAANVAAVVAFASALNAAGLVLASGMYLAHRTRAMPLVTIGAAAANVALNVLLIPLIGIMGAAVATLGAYLALAVLIGLVSRRHYPVALDVGRVAVAAAVAVGLALLSRTVGPAEQPAAVGWHLLVAAASTVAIGFLLRASLDRLRALLATTPLAHGIIEGVG